MPLKASVQYGAAEAITVTFNISTARARAMTLRFANRHNLVKEGMSEVQIGEAVLRFLFRGVAQESEETQGHDLMDAQMAAITTTVKADNALDP